MTEATDVDVLSYAPQLQNIIAPDSFVLKDSWSLADWHEAKVFKAAQHMMLGEGGRSQDIRRGASAIFPENARPWDLTSGRPLLTAQDKQFPSP